MKIAVIDLGTNTFHLVISESADGTYQEIAKKRIYVRLGEGGLSASHITPEAWKRALDAMKEFQEIIDAHQVKEVYAVGTSALRNARNGADLIKAIEQQTKIHVEVISGKQEAALIYRGVKEAVHIAENEIALIMDIGGGSVEFIICDNKRSLWEQSFEIGAQRLVDNFNQHSYILPEELTNMEKYLAKHLQPLFQAVDMHRPTRLIGSSGAFTTIGAILSAKQEITVAKEDTSYDIPFDSFVQLYKEIRYTTHEDRLKIPGLSDQRVDMIVVSMALIYFVINKTNLHYITASRYSLKVGLFFEILDKIQGRMI
jgi:exopolyphosphatase/guanosine-5'-triphosphate,3'-diphosphate pyrophosphatase